MTFKKTLLVLIMVVAVAGGILLTKKNWVKEGGTSDIPIPLKLAIVSASPTYPEHGYETALDGNPNDGYVAGIEGNKHFVLLQLSRSTNLSSVQIDWDSDANLARKVRVTTLGGNASEPDRVLAQVEGLNTKTSQIPLKDAMAVQTLKIEFDDYAGQQRVLLRQIRLQPMPGQPNSQSAVEHLVSAPLELVKLTVVKASPTYPGFGFDTAVDGNPDDNYVAGVEYNKHFVILELSRSADLAAIDFDWESEANRARKVKVMAWDIKEGESDRVLAEVEGLDSKISRIPLKDAMGVKALKIEFGDYAGQSRVLLRQIRLSFWY